MGKTICLEIINTMGQTYDRETISIETIALDSMEFIAKELGDNNAYNLRIKIIGIILCR